MGTVNKQGLGVQMPPDPDHVKIYFLQKGMEERDAEAFLRFQELNGWKRPTGTRIRNWKTAACDWIWELQHKR